MVSEEFPGNTNRARESARKHDPVVKGGVTMRKRPLGKRFAETFIQGDIHSVREDVFWNIIVPRLKDIVLAGGWEGLQVLLFGVSRRGAGSTTTGTNYRYERDSRHSPDAVLGRTRPEPSRRARASHDFRDILFDSRVEAEEVLSTLEAAIEKYDQVSVADLYDMCDVKADFTDDQWGWTDLRSAEVRPARHGKYIIDMPRPVSL